MRTIGIAILLVFGVTTGARPAAVNANPDDCNISKSFGTFKAVTADIYRSHLLSRPRKAASSVAEIVSNTQPRNFAFMFNNLWRRLISVSNSVASPLLWLVVQRSPKLHASSLRRDSAVHYSFARRSSCALIATMTVLADMRTAANAGGSRMPCLARTPAANGIATMLYPAAHQRFCIIFR